MAMTRKINGVNVELSAKEEQDVLAEWAANMPGPAPKIPTLQDVINVLSPDQKAAIALAATTKLPTP